MPLVFKASYDKANRSSHATFRGPGMDEGLEILAEVKATLGLPLVSDVHEPAQAERAAKTLDVLQIPAFLCRQTDLLVACAKTGRIINVKKGQFLAPEDMANVAAKVETGGGTGILLTERGSSFGYHTLVNDFRGLPIMARTGWPVVFDATHSVEQPGGLGDSSGGDREMIPYLARAAVACGVDGLFLECHDDPDNALSDAPNQLDLKDLPRLLREVLSDPRRAATNMKNPKKQPTSRRRATAKRASASGPPPGSEADRAAVNTIRFLAVDMVERARSGHPGAPMGQAAMAYQLWSRFCASTPADPEWPNRDRFVLSCGHASALLYALLHLAATSCRWTSCATSASSAR